jgi:hypothetical protein
MIPLHYPQSYDVIQFVKDNDLNFNEGNIIKYITRARKKGTHLKDLEKAQDYLQREIEYLRTKELQNIERL